MGNSYWLFHLPPFPTISKSSPQTCGTEKEAVIGSSISFLFQPVQRVAHKFVGRGKKQLLALPFPFCSNQFKEKPSDLWDGERSSYWHFHFLPVPTSSKSSPRERSSYWLFHFLSVPTSSKSSPQTCETEPRIIERVPQRARPCVLRNGRTFRQTSHLERILQPSVNTKSRSTCTFNTGGRDQPRK